MKKIKLFPALILIVLFTVTGNDTMAQRRGRQADTSGTARERGRQEREVRTTGARDQADTLRNQRERVQDTTKEAMREQRERKERENRGNQGNAYGKNKGDLQGREFGQERARQARMNRENSEKELDELVAGSEQKAVEARERIRVKREEIERARRENRISEEEFEENSEKLKEAERVLNELEKKVEKGKKLKEKKQD
ncbi:MAG: hypothetical protein LC649_10780 [Bacteroidales bacterium]|nr:hypothetical protein [Bacteroidales bacterium]